jgi:hypothetical protein
MNLVDLEKKLIAAARLNPPSGRVPYAFEKRVMALIASRAVLDRWALWSGALWRGAASCLALVMVLGALSHFTTPRNSVGDFSQDFERTMLAAAIQPDTDISW